MDIKRFLAQVINNFAYYKKDQYMTYEDGLILITALQAYECFNDSSYLDFIDIYLEKAIDENGDIKNYHKTEYNIDNILAGNVLFKMYEKTKKEKYAACITKLYQQILNQPRNKLGSFWHKLRYPSQVWLDGIYMGQVFYLRYANFINNNELTNMIESDVIKQFETCYQTNFDTKTQLLVHCYDDARLMQWADKETGQSKYVWLRAMGWYLMALADAYPLMKNSLYRESLKTILKNLITQIIPFNHNFLWHNIIGVNDDRNYFESSGTAMIAYAITKAVQNCMLDKEYLMTSKKIMEAINQYFITEKNNTYFLAGTVKVSGLDGAARDGSLDYYFSEPIVTNEIKGLSPFLNAHLLLLMKNK